MVILGPGILINPSCVFLFTLGFEERCSEIRMGVAQNETIGGANRRFWSMFPLTKVPFRYRFFEPQPHVCFQIPVVDAYSMESISHPRHGLPACQVLAKVIDPERAFAPF